MYMFTILFKPKKNPPKKETNTKENKNIDNI